MYKNFQLKIPGWGLSKCFLNKIYKGTDYINLLISPALNQAFFKIKNKKLKNILTYG